MYSILPLREHLWLEMPVNQFWQFVGMGSCNISNIGSLEKRAPFFAELQNTHLNIQFTAVSNWNEH